MYLEIATCIDSVIIVRTVCHFQSATLAGAAGDFLVWQDQAERRST